MEFTHEQVLEVFPTLDTMESWALTLSDTWRLPGAEAYEAQNTLYVEICPIACWVQRELNSQKPYVGVNNLYIDEETYPLTPELVEFRWQFDNLGERIQYERVPLVWLSRDHILVAIDNTRRKLR